jgi:hypothetical protein
MKRCINVKLFLSLVQTNLCRLNYSFRDFSTSSAVISGLNLEIKQAMNLCFFVTIGKEAQFLAPIRGRRRCLTVITAGAPVDVFCL